MEFTFTPNWFDSVTETLSWLTVIEQSNTTKATKRDALRGFPRRSFDYKVTLAGTDRQELNFWAMKARPQIYAVPFPIPTGRQAIGSVTQGATSLSCDTSSPDLTVSGQVMLIDKSGAAERLTITAKDVGALTFSTAVQADYKHAALYPVKMARITVGEESRETADISDFSITAILTESSTQAAAVWDYEYLDLPVWTFAPNEVTLPFSEIEIVAGELDNETARASHLVDMMERAFFTQKEACTIATPSAFFPCLWALEGRLNPVWKPSFQEDFKVKGTITGGASSITVEKNEAVGLDTIDHIAIKTVSGWLFRAVSSITETSSSLTMTFDTALPSPMPSVQSVCVLRLMCLASDEVSIEWTTGSVADVSLSFEEVTPNV